MQIPIGFGVNLEELRMLRAEALRTLEHRNQPLSQLGVLDMVQATIPWTFLVPHKNR